MPPGFFKWEPIPFNNLIVPALFTIIAPGFTEEVGTFLPAGHFALASMMSRAGSSWLACCAPFLVSLPAMPCCHGHQSGLACTSKESNSVPLTGQVLGRFGQNTEHCAVPPQAIFRAALLPHPAVDGTHYPKSALEFAISAALPLAIFVAYHLVRAPTLAACENPAPACSTDTHMLASQAKSLPALRC